MAKLSILAGATSQSVSVFIQNSSSTSGAGLTGLVYNTSNLIAYYAFNGANGGSNVIALATLAAANSAYSSGGFKEIDSTNMPGLYRLDIPNAATAGSKGRSSVIMLSGAANMAPLLLEIELTGWDNQNAVNGGITALPNTACTTNASLLTSGTGTAQISAASGVVAANAQQLLGTAISTPATAGILDVNLKNISNAAVSTTAAQIGTNAVQVNGQTTSAAGTVTFPGSIASPTNITAGTITTVTNLTNAPTAGDFTSTMKTSLNAATPASIVGAVGSVTGNVGGNVVGSVGSVTGAVGSVTGNVGGNVSGSVASVVGNVGGNVVGSVGSVLATVAANLTQILGTALTEVSGQLAASFKQFFNIASPTSTMNTITAVTTVTNLTNAPTVGDFTSTMKTSLNAATPASITGAVGSVTGNVGGNVTGSVGSVAGNVAGSVASVVGNVGGNVVGSVGSVIGLTASNLDTTVSSRLATSGYTAPNNAGISAIESQTNLLQFDGSNNVLANTQIATSQIEVKKDQALNNFEFIMTDSTTHNPLSGLTVTTTISIDGAAPVASTNSASSVGSGIYKINLSAADLNGDVITLCFTATGADTRFVTIVTQA